MQTTWPDESLKQFGRTDGCMQGKISIFVTSTISSCTDLARLITNTTTLAVPESFSRSCADDVGLAGFRLDASQDQDQASFRTYHWFSPLGLAQKKQETYLRLVWAEVLH